MILGSKHKDTTGKFFIAFDEILMQKMACIKSTLAKNMHTMNDAGFRNYAFWSWAF